MNDTKKNTKDSQLYFRSFKMFLSSFFPTHDKLIGRQNFEWSRMSMI